MVAHHDGVLEEQKVGTAPELFDLGQGPRWRSLCSDGNQFGELKVILTYVVRILSIDTGLPSRKRHEEVVSKDGSILSLFACKGASFSPGKPS